MTSNFDEDLSREGMLGKFLDGIYAETLRGFEIERISDNKMQHKGVDIIIRRGTREYFIDEKAQLDYVGSELPTFAFEISYLISGTQHLGWLFDTEKITHRYFAVTGIYLNVNGDYTKGFKTCRIVSVDRTRLLRLLASRGLDYKRIMEINQNIRLQDVTGKIPIEELDTYSEGSFNYSRANKAEAPINVVLKLAFLKKEGVAKSLYR